MSSSDIEKTKTIDDIETNNNNQENLINKNSNKNEIDKIEEEEKQSFCFLKYTKQTKYSLIELYKELKHLDSNLKLFENSIQNSEDFLKYSDKSFDIYIDDQIKISKIHQKGIKSKTKFFTYEVAKYFLAKIPNNYFDAMHIVNLTSELIYESPNITEWTEEDIVKWFDSIGLNNHSNIIRENNVNGMTLLKMNICEYKEILGIQDTKDTKLLMKSIDFLRIFVKLKLDFHDYLEYERNEREKNENILLNTQQNFYNNLNLNSMNNNNSNPSKFNNNITLINLNNKLF